MNTSSCHPAPSQDIKSDSGDVIHRALSTALKLKQSGKVNEAIELLADLVRTTSNPVAARRMVSAMLSKGMYSRILEYPQTRPYNSRSYALAEHLHHIDRSQIDSLCLDHPVASGLALVTMVRNEQDIIYYNLAWHYMIGVRRFVLVDNHSDDKTVVSALKFERDFNDVEMVIIRDPLTPRNQSAKVTGSCRFALSVWPDLEWMLLVDADEFVCCSQPLYPLLSSIPLEIDALILPKSQYCLKDEYSTKGKPFFERMPNRSPLTHISPKIIVRAKLEFIVGAGSHGIKEIGASRYKYLSPIGLTMREFRKRSVEQFIQRVITGGPAAEKEQLVNPSFKGGSHWISHYREYQKAGEEALHRIFSSEANKASLEATICDMLPLQQAMNIPQRLNS